MRATARRCLAAVAVTALTSAGAVATSEASSAAPQLSAAHSARSAPLNTLGVKLVRFAKGTTADQMVAAITAAGGQVVSDLSRLGRVAATSSSPGFDAAIARDARVKAVWTDRVIPLDRVDTAPAGQSAAGDVLPTSGTAAVPDPWHDLDAFLNENAPGVLQWDDDVNGARTAWTRTTGDRTVRVAVIDTGVTGSHKEIAPNYDNQASANTIPCDVLVRQFGPLGQMDCSMVDTEGHGTWVASRVAGAVNGFASNGIAPGVQIVGYKALSTTLGGGLTSWIVDAMRRACDSDVDLINMSLGGWDAPGVDDEDYLLWLDATDYCRARGVAVIASAGNDHVRVNKVAATIGGRQLTGVGQASTGDEGVGTVIPGSPLSDTDLRGLYETPAGVPGVIMVSSTANANGAPVLGSLDHLASKPTVGARNQLAYYSNYGSRIDVAAPGGARKIGVPRYDAGTQDVLYGGWGELGALTDNGEICQDPSTGSLLTFACFKVNGAAFGWLQGTSMSAPNATGVAALVLSAHHELQGNPAGLLTRLKGTARTAGLVNETGPNRAADTGASASGVPCTTGYCHLQYYPGGSGNPVTFADAYGAGMVDAGAAVR